MEHNVLQKVIFYAFATSLYCVNGAIYGVALAITSFKRLFSD